jgi:hypothetical protein
VSRERHRVHRNQDRLYPLIAALIAGAVEVGAWVAARSCRIDEDAPDIATLTGASLGLLAFSFWLAVTATEPQSLPAYRFVASLNEMNNIHESRLTALRYQIPGAVMFLLVVVAMVATGFTGYYAGARGTHGRATTLIMALTVAVVIMLVIDLDCPQHGLILVPVQPQIDAQQGIPP